MGTIGKGVCRDKRVGIGEGKSQGVGCLEVVVLKRLGHCVERMEWEEVLERRLGKGMRTRKRNRVERDKGA